MALRSPGDRGAATGTVPTGRRADALPGVGVPWRTGVPEARGGWAPDTRPSAEDAESGSGAAFASAAALKTANRIPAAAVTATAPR